MNNIQQRLTNIFQEYGISIYEIEYYPMIFGNFVYSFEYKGQKYNFINDRGEIMLNHKYIDEKKNYNSKM
jgi:hypothetical protein